MMNYLFAFLMAVSIIFGAVSGRMSEVSSSVFDGAKASVELFLTLLGMISFWSGIMRITEKSGITGFLQKCLSPILSLIFKGLSPDSAAARAISMNIAANFLGLGNAATPLGLLAMKELKKDSKLTDTATNNMVMFVVINTASLQLIPTTVAAMRAESGAENSMDIMPAVWFASILSLIFGIVSAKLLERRQKND